MMDLHELVILELKKHIRITLNCAVVHGGWDYEETIVEWYKFKMVNPKNLHPVNYNPMWER